MPHSSHGMDGEIQALLNTASKTEGIMPPERIESSFKTILKHPKKLFSVRNAFKAWGGVGFALGLPLSLILASHAQLSPLLMALIAIAALGALLSTAIASVVLTRNETLIFYRGVIFIFSVAALISKLLHKPVMEYMDITALGSALFLACGRIGCLSVGCCHGRPFRWGVFYGEAHVRTGFARWLKGVRLFPIQAVESFWALSIVVFGSIWFWRGSLPGAVFAFCTVVYGLGRFFLEFFRGDDARAYFLSFSEAQWTSLVLIAGVVFAGWFGILPYHCAHLAILIFLCVATAGTSLIRMIRHSSPHRLFSASHINEMARTILFLQSQEASPLLPGNFQPIHLAETSEKLRVSFGRVRRYKSCVAHFSVSWPEHVLTKGDAKRFAQLLVNLLNCAQPCRIVMTSLGVYHFLFSLH